MMPTFTSKRLLALASTLALTLWPALSLRAQTAAAGTITGTVTDSSGAIVPKAAVVVTDTPPRPRTLAPLSSPFSCPVIMKLS